ncbi:MAG: AMP-binding enzyme [Candidatus Helarchaeota archaeon]
MTKNNELKYNEEKDVFLEVERIIREHPAVAEVCIIEIQDSKKKKSLRAVVQLEPGHNVSENDLLEFCHGKMEEFKKPNSFIFTMNLPITAVGKIKRGEIKKLFGEQGYKGLIKEEIKKS